METGRHGMRPTAALRLSHNRIEAVLIRALSVYHSRTLPVRDALEQSVAVLRWMRESRSASVTGHVHGRELMRLVQRYTKDEVPLAYLLGTQPFGSLELDIRPPVLIPRPETEEWTMSLVEELRRCLSHGNPASSPKSQLKILDLCSGSGCIGLLVAHELRRMADIRLMGVDIGTEAIDLARQNARKYGLEDITVFAQCDIFDNAAVANFAERHGKFDMVVSNPPYIPRAEYERLERSVRDYEDRKALLGERPDISRHTGNGETHNQSQGTYNEDENGLTFYRRLRFLIPHLLIPDSNLPRECPQVVLEVGHDQARKVMSLFENEKAWRSSIRSDFRSIERSVWLHGL